MVIRLIDPCLALHFPTCVHGKAPNCQRPVKRGLLTPEHGGGYANTWLKIVYKTTSTVVLTRPPCPICISLPCRSPTLFYHTKRLKYSRQTRFLRHSLISSRRLPYHRNPRQMMLLHHHSRALALPSERFPQPHRRPKPRTSSLFRKNLEGRSVAGMEFTSGQCH